MRRALDLRSAIALGVQVSFESILADELCAMGIIREEVDLLDRENSVQR